MQGSSDANRELLDADALCRHLVAKGSVEDFLADHRGELFPDEMFADLFPTRRGRPSVPADVVATVMVLQSLEGLSDRDAAAQLRTNIAWKMATGLSLADPGFHPTVLTLWRNKLRSSEAPQRIFDAVRAVIAESGAIAGKHRRALDSTVLDDAVVRQDAIMQLVAQIRRVRRAVPEAKALELSAHDYDHDPGKPACAWDDQEAIDAMVSALVGDALVTLAALEGQPLDGAQSEAVGLLALVAGQDVEPGDEEGTWRIAPRSAPHRMVSVIDPESRHVHKTNHNYRDGFKAHIGIEPDSGLITACELTPGNVGDAQAAVGLLEAEPARTEVLADSAYGSAELRRSLEAKRAHRHHQADAAAPGDPGWLQHRRLRHRHHGSNGHLPQRDHRHHHPSQQGRVRCEVQRVPASSPMHEGEEGAQHEHSRAPRRALCRSPCRRDRGVPGDLSSAPAHGRALDCLARGQREPQGRYRGIARNQIWLAHRCAAINLRRLINLGLIFDRGGWALAAG